MIRCNKARWKIETNNKAWLRHTHIMTYTKSNNNTVQVARLETTQVEWVESNRIIDT